MLSPSNPSSPLLTPSLSAAAPLSSPDDDTPYVLSYLALRQAVGYIALLLPWVLYIGANIGHSWRWRTSISGYYYTDMRNVFVGSLCAISMFQLACRGYKNRLGQLDTAGSWLSGLLALCVAFCPTTPQSGDGVIATHLRCVLGHIHIASAVLLFLTLSGFCFWIFRLSTSATPTPRKFVRNRVFTLCGWGILASMAFVPFADHLLHWAHGMFLGEMAALTFFGAAWLVKGQAILKDKHHDASPRVKPRVP